jgi:hypothetical protein
MTLLFVQRARLLAVLAGLAWMLGLTPSAPVRLLVVAGLVLGTVIDAWPDRTPRAIRITTLRGRGR